MKPVEYSIESKALEDQFLNRAGCDQSPDYWSDELVKPLKKEVKTHYVAEQSRRCCYCGFEYPTDNHAVWDVEHIIARSRAVRFMFEPLNLAASCKDCNIAKSEDEVRRSPTRKSFPDKSQHYLIVHPHFDSYEQHIRWYGKVVRPLTQKGRKLVEMCNLQRFGLIEIGAAVGLVDAGFDELIGSLMNPHASRIQLQATVAAIAEYVKSVPQK